MTDPLAILDATAQAELVRTKEISPLELVDAAINRIEKLNPQLNAIIHPLFQKAREEAAEGLSNGPFCGVPFLIKDVVCHTAGDPFHMGSQILKNYNYIASEDSALARRYRQAGFIFVGKTNTPEFATSATTEPLAYGPTLNPWNVLHSPGGSSGGSAAAVAAGLTAVAHGNDMGGSIRIPSGYCGLVGLKPTRARNTLAPNFGEYWGMLTHEHVLTRSVRDTAGILDATAYPETGDPYMAPPPQRAWRHEVGADPGRLKIGFRTQGMETTQLPTDCSAAVQHTARLLESLGHSVEEDTLSALEDERLMSGMGVVMASAIARDVQRINTLLGIDVGPENMEPMNAMLYEMGRAITASDYLKAVEELQGYSRRLCVWWSDWDLLLTPTSALVTPKIGELAPNAEFEKLFSKQRLASFFTSPFNVTGQPAISLPLYWTDTGLPVGIQLVAGYGREDILIRVASQLEEAQPWSERKPLVHA